MANDWYKNVEEAPASSSNDWYQDVPQQNKESWTYALTHAEPWEELGKQALLATVGTRDTFGKNNVLGFMSPYANKAEAEKALGKQSVKNAQTIQDYTSAGADLVEYVALETATDGFASPFLAELGVGTKFAKYAPVASRVASNAVASLGIQAGHGDASASQTGEDVLLNEVLHGGGKLVGKAIRPIASRVVKSGESYLKGEAAQDALQEEFNRGYAAFQGDSFLAMAKNELKKNPDTTVEDLFSQWSDIHPEMAKANEDGVSQIGRVKDALFGGEDVGKMSEEEIASYVNAAKAQATGDIFAARALGDSDEVKNFLDAMAGAENNRRFYELPVNPNKLEPSELEELGVGKAYRGLSNVLGFSEKALLEIPSMLRGPAVDRARNQIIDGIRTRLVREIGYLRRSIVDLKEEGKGLSGNHAILHNRKLAAFGHQLKADEKLLRNFDTASKGRKVNTESLYNFYKEAQDNLFEGAEQLHEDSQFSGLQSDVRDAFKQLNVLNDLKKSNSPSLIAAFLSTASLPAELFALPVTLSAASLKSLLDRSVIRDALKGRDLAQSFAISKSSTVKELESVRDMAEGMGVPEDALHTLDDEIEKLKSTTFSQYAKEMLSEEQEKVDKAFTKARKVATATGSVVNNRLSDK
ncbi:hypothetical protein HVY71_12445 [Citrobacter freundii]|uniref:hypothetical protein n=1 Tax=Citrobacter portucalensis TaxID=1639133 RepID=UPI0015E9237C|nr:hypothetical protein HVY71_12445 [Citrobacter freundii]